ncbi:fanconi anemia group F protein (FANCF) [Thalictrum thalictroides]|uniref:Fanconi anemia group F protein (FANCF) n=1 Tax=Thalictrum thalictroides TaxID=46969 RepID=A0A7J6VJF4_THATH|nr:fanconi anemia group F protein (FANCF) [Thalictrum thalictroides]
MGWSHPDISLEDLVNLIKGFVDIIVLASGYQSSGLPAIWDSSNIKKALQWGLFFEDVFGRLSISDHYENSIKELDAVLVELKAEPYFPQGLSNLSSATLTGARAFVVKHLIHTFSLRDAHLNSLLTASVEMDLDDLRKTEYDCLTVYLENLMLQTTSSVPHTSSANPVFMIKEHASCCHSELLIQELLKRQAVASHVSSVELGLDILSESVTHICKGIPPNDVSLLSKEQFTELVTWSQWRSRSLSYLLNKRTVRLVSGAKLIFSAPKVQWLQMFEQLKDSNESHDDNFLETMEILLLGCASRRWTQLIEKFISVSYCFLPIANQYQELHNLPQGRSQSLHFEQENSIVEYLTELLSSQLHQLWNLSPVLAAIAIPSW